MILGLSIVAALLILLAFCACLWARVVDLEGRVDSIAKGEAQQ